MHEDYCKSLLEDFLKNSWLSVKAIVEKLSSFQRRETRWAGNIISLC